MPHAVIEYSQTLSQRPDGPSGSQLVEVVFEGALASGLFDRKDIKCRALPYNDYCVAGDQRDFVHVVVYLLDGRDKDQKKHLSQSVFDQLKSLIKKDCSLTVDVRDIQRDIYCKDQI